MKGTDTMRYFKLLLMVLACVAGCTSQRQCHTLDTGWRYCQAPQEKAHQVEFDDTAWQSVTVPHTWNTDLIQNQNDASYYKGDGWYRLRLPVTNGMKGKRLFLRFEGALAIAEVYLNGKEVGRHIGGYTAFCYEITDCIQWGQRNILAVKVNNADFGGMVPANDRLFTRFGGIYRPVTLLVTEPACITPLDYASCGVYIRADSVTEQKADLTITTELSNARKTAVPLTVHVRICDAEDHEVARGSETLQVQSGATVPVEQKLAVLSPHLWNGRIDPYLYQVKIEVTQDGKTVDRLTQPLGLRYFSVDADKGFFLNGRHYDMHGVCRHQEWEHEGSALTDVHHRRDVETMMEIGATTVRLAHYPQSATMYRLCDENGLIVWAEIPVVQGTDLRKEGAFDNAKQQLVEMIRQNYNNPSICFWGLYNECWTPVEMVQEMQGLAKREDPTRLTTAASNQGLKEKHHITDVIAWNKYPMWYGNFKLDELLDGYHQGNPHLKIGVSEYGAGGCIDQHQIPPERPNPSKGPFFSEEYQCLVHETVWPILEQRPYLWGTYLWNLFDFSWPGVARGNRINLNHKGLITYDRKIKKDAFYYYKANWSQEPVLYIASRRFVERTEAVTEIKVYSNCQQIELTVNGTSFPAPQGSYGVYKWPNMLLAEGRNEIRVTAVSGDRKIRDDCVWNLSLDSAPLPTAEKQTVESVHIAGCSASTEQSEQGHTASKAVDDNPETCWTAADNRLPQWVLMDLLQQTDIAGVMITWDQEGPYEYTVQVSDDGSDWKIMATNTENGQAVTHRFKTTTRFVRVHCTKAPSGQKAAIRDIKVLAD